MGQQKRMHRSHATTEIPVNVARQMRRGRQDGVRLENGGGGGQLCLHPKRRPPPIPGV